MRLKPHAHEIEAVRKRMMLGASLADAADCLGIEPHELDLILWDRVIRHSNPSVVIRRFGSVA